MRKIIDILYAKINVFLRVGESVYHRGEENPFDESLWVMVGQASYKFLLYWL